MTVYKTSIITFVALTLATCTTETILENQDHRGAEAPR